MEKRRSAEDIRENITQQKKAQEKRLEACKEYTEMRIGRLEKPAAEICLSMKGEIESEKYDSILSDDAGARIHSLLMTKVLEQLYEDKKFETFFVQGGSMLKFNRPMQEKVRAYLEKIGKYLGENVLIVTEEMYSGRSVKFLAQALQNLGKNVDVATFGITEEDEEGVVKDIQDRMPKGVKLFNGGSCCGSQLPEEMTGLWHRDETTEGSPNVKSLDEEEKLMMRTARELLPEVADRVVKKYQELKDVEYDDDEGEDDYAW